MDLCLVRKSKNQDTNVLYPYENIDGVSIPIQLDDYPNVKKYLLEYKTELSNRSYFVEHSSKIGLNIGPHAHLVYLVV